MHAYDDANEAASEALDDLLDIAKLEPKKPE
jgi:hypothetical protein